MLRTFAIAGSVLALAAGVTLASVQFSTGPPASRTGAPAAGALTAEGDCSGCHIRFDQFDNPINNVNLPGGQVEILDLPTNYIPGQTYTLHVRLASDSTLDDPDRKWGFEITAFRTSDGHGTGTFLIATSELQIKSGNPAGQFATRRYVEHTSDGTRTALLGPVTWEFQWQAPPVSDGDILFCAAGNAADGTLDPGNDNIYTTNVVVHPDVTPVATTTWGFLKQRYR